MSINTTSVCHCGAKLNWLTGTVTYGCDEPCRFIMQKSGEGDPPIPTQDFILGYKAGLKDKCSK